MKRMGIAALAGALAWCVTGPASGASATWSRTYGGDAAEGVMELAEAADGSLLVGGVTDSFGTATGDAWLLRLDAAGSVITERACGIAVPGGAQALALLPDGGAVVAGRDVLDIYILHEAWIARLDAAGNALWTTRFSAPIGRFFVNDLLPTADGGFLAAGSTAVTDGEPQHAWLVKLDGGGTVLWQRQLASGVGSEVLVEAVELAGGGFALAGWSTTPGTSDALALRVDADGQVLWQRTFGGPGQDEATGIAVLPGDRVVLSGFTDSFTASSHAGWVLLLDDAGALAAHAVVGDGEWSDLRDVRVRADGSLLLTGRVAEAGAPTNDLWLLAMDPSLAGVTWQRALAGDSGDWGAAGVELAGGGLLVGGTWAWGFEGESAWLVRTDRDGRMDAACGLVRDTSAPWSSPRLAEADALLAPVAVSALPGQGAVVVSDTAASVVTQCLALPCVPAPPPPPELSDVAAGAPPLRVSEHGARLDFEGLAEAGAYNVHVDVLGSWYAPSAARGTTCHRTDAVANGDGTVRLAADIPAGSWLVVTASDACAEGSAGADSFGAPRRDQGTWEGCGPVH